MSHEHVPTEKSRQNVELLAASGFSQEVIAGMVGVSVPTLKRHYDFELKFGKAKMLQPVAATLFHGAIGRPAKYDERGNKVQSELKPNYACAMFIMKCQGGWKETNVVEHIDPTAGARERLAAACDRALAAAAVAGQNPPSPEPDRERLN